MFSGWHKDPYLVAAVFSVMPGCLHFIQLNPLAFHLLCCLCRLLAIYGRSSQLKGQRGTKH